MLHVRVASIIITIKTTLAVQGVLLNAPRSSKKIDEHTAEFTWGFTCIILIINHSNLFTRKISQKLKERAMQTKIY